MAKIVAIVNQKGGVGKTTTCVNLTAALKERDKNVLLCDFDPQANATSGMGVDKTLSLGVYEAIINEVPPEKLIVSTKYGDVLPSSKGLAGAGVEMIGLEHREFRLREIGVRISLHHRKGNASSGTAFSGGRAGAVYDADAEDDCLHASGRGNFEY